MRFLLLRLKNVFLLMFPVVSSEDTFDSAVTKSGTGTWGLGRGTLGRGDVGAWGHGDVGREHAQGLEDVIFAMNLTNTIFGGQVKGNICWRVCRQTNS